MPVLRIMLRLLPAININVSLLCAVQANLYVSVQFDDGVFAKVEEESWSCLMGHKSERLLGFQATART